MDISLCCRLSCSQKEKCFRFMAEPDVYGDFYTEFKPVVDNGQKFECKWFMDIEKYSTRFLDKKVK